ncbi:MAG: hypothetical protein OCD01_18865 [Fibrobacterales bacterium]
MKSLIYILLVSIVLFGCFATDTASIEKAEAHSSETPFMGSSSESLSHSSDSDNHFSTQSEKEQSASSDMYDDATESSSYQSQSSNALRDTYDSSELSVNALSSDNYSSSFSSVSSISSSLNETISSSTQRLSSSQFVEPYVTFNGNSGTFIDLRDNREYKWVRIGEQIWMAQNLNYDNGGSQCINSDDEPDCKLFGRKYTVETALGGEDGSESSPSGIQGMCPTHWHIPSYDEWDQLMVYIGKDLGITRENTDFNSHARQVAHTVRATDYWTDELKGIDSYGFTALPTEYDATRTYWHTTKTYENSSPTESYKASISRLGFMFHSGQPIKACYVRCVYD